MAAFMDLFDPSLTDEPVEDLEDLDELLSASALLDNKKSNGTNQNHQNGNSKTPKTTKRIFPNNKLPPRSKTTLDLSTHYTCPASSAEMANLAIGTVWVRTRIRSSHSEGDFHSLPPEPQMGNVEYKLKLVNPTAQRLEHLVTQMKWRLREGQGEAIYEIGVEDNGLMTGLSDVDMDSSIETLREMARRLEATIQVLRDRVVVTEDGVRYVAEILVRKVPDDRQCIDLRVCILGSADVGKSTLLGVLTQGQLDNGRGRARLNMFRHLHEIQTGRTSSISHEILGFDSEGNSVDYSTCSTAEEICENATKLLTFIDLAGHQRYLRTTLSGLTGYSPHYVMLVISASAGMATMTQEHLQYAIALEVPFFIVMTKVDMTPKAKLLNTMENLKKFLLNAGSKKVPLIVKSSDDIINAVTNTPKENVVPIFIVSCVSGSGLPEVKRFLHLLPPGIGVKIREKLEQANPEFQIDEIFDVPNVGCVVGGLVSQGIITEGMSLNLGPFEDGTFRSVVVTSIKRNRAPCRLVRATQSAALAIECHVNDVRKGMVLVDTRADDIQCTMLFKASVNLLYHPTAIQEGFRTTVHIGNVRQTAVIHSIQPLQQISMNNDKANVVFKFIRYPEYIKPGARLLFREGRTKGMGRVTEIEPYDPRANLNR